MGGPARDEIMKKIRAGKAVQDPIHDEVTRKEPDRQGHLG